MPRKKSKKVDLIDEEGDNLGFELDKEFEKRFEYNQKRKELHRLQEKYGDTADLESSDEESEDEDAEADTPATERGFLRTLSLLKGNVPQLLDTKEPLYEEDDSQEGGDGDNDDEEKNEKKKKKKDKPMTLKDHERRRILTRQTDAMLSDDDEEEIGKATGENADDLRTQFALEGGDDDDDVDALLQKKEISTEEKEKQQADYLEWLQGREIELNRKMKAELQPLRRYWTDNTLSSEDKFLRDYITRRMWRNDGGEDDDTINYFDPEVDNEDDEHVERTEEYERQYNFRFEEPGATEIKSYPRVIAASARREKDTRKAARQRKKERKELEKKQKEEEISRLKKLKREQIKAKLRQIAEISGHDPAALEGLDLDLDAEFDPDKFNQQLEKLFNDDYYGDEEKKKPKLPEDVDAAVFDDAYPPVPEAGEGYGEEGGEAYEGYGEEGYEGHGEEGYEGGADGYEGHGEEGYDGGDGSFAPVPEGEAATTAVSLEEGAKTLQHLSKRQRKKLERQRRREAKQKAKKGVITDLQTQDDVHVDDTKTVNDYLEELHKLDFEDIVGGMPTRFKYRQVMPNDYGLSTEEILHAEDKELNGWVSVKKLSKYRSEDEEKHDVRKYKRRAKNKVKKLQQLPSIAPLLKQKDKKQHKKKDRHEGADGNDKAADAAEEKEEKKHKQQEDDGDDGAGEGDEQPRKRAKTEKKKKKKTSSGADKDASSTKKRNGKKKGDKGGKKSDKGHRKGKKAKPANISASRLKLYKSLATRPPE